jgi:hypothetical protein
LSSELVNDTASTASVSLLTSKFFILAALANAAKIFFALL